MRLAYVALVMSSILLAVNAAEHNEGKPGPKLWAGISVNRALFQQGRVRGEPVRPVIAGEPSIRLTLSFVLVNDGRQEVDPELASSQLLVNGEPLGEWPSIVNSGPGDSRRQSLPPGEELEFAYALGKYFDQVGTYRVQWKGKHFESSEVVFRVVARKG